ncbi:MAG: hypothetical protein GWN62_35885, partial [Aliifodinibius sp.]|nr:hypothetical protein [Fodinibius sp.]
MYDINTYQNRDVKEKSRDNLPGDDKKRILHRTAPPSTVLRNTEHKITAGHGYPNSQYAFFS